MGEKIAPAATSNEPPRMPSPTAVTENDVPGDDVSGNDVSGNRTAPVPAHIHDPTNSEAATAATTNGSTELALSMEQAYYEQILENAPEAISIIDHDLNISRVNAEFTRLFGFTAAEAVGKRLDSLIVPPDRYAETAWIHESMKTKNKLSLETLRRRKDESLVEVLLSTSPVMVNGKKIGFYACYRDITEQKRAEELNAALYAIAARSQAEDLQTFFAAVHNIIGQLMNARNFYIALYDFQSQLLSFPYFVDEQDPTPKPKRLGRGLTEYVLRTGEPLLRLQPCSKNW
jgi:PAS domain S-box-containing protein